MLQMIPSFSLIDYADVKPVSQLILAQVREEPGSRQTTPKRFDSSLAVLPGEQLLGSPGRGSWSWGFYALLALALMLLAPLPVLAVGETTLISVASNGTQPTCCGSDGAGLGISADGRYIVFQADSDGLAPGDVFGTYDVYVRDRVQGTTTRISDALDGQPGNGDSEIPSISADGRYVAFVSFASNLVAGDTNGEPNLYTGADVFVYDMKKGETTRVSVASDGTQGNGDSFSPTISADGHYVAFTSRATNLVSGDSNGTADIFLHDRWSGRTTRVNAAFDGTQANGPSGSPEISPDGRSLTFMSEANNLVPGDTNWTADIILRRDDYFGSVKTLRVSVASNGAQGNDASVASALSADGLHVAFWSHADNLVAGDTNGSEDIYVHNYPRGKTKRVSVASDGTQGNGSSYNPAISADGRFVTFESDADNLVPGDTNGHRDIFLHDGKSSQTVSVNVAATGSGSNADSSTPAISADGRYIAFSSYANNLVPIQTKPYNDNVFLRDRLLTPDKSADVEVSLSKQPGAAPVLKGYEFYVTLKIVNNGPDPATDLALTHVASSNNAVLAAVPNQGTCHLSPIIVCRLGTLRAHHSAEVVVKLKPRHKGVYPNVFSVNAAPVDPVPDNNSRTKWVRVN